jgi:hypothetical protein
MSKAFEFAENFSKPAMSVVAGFQKWQAWVCRLSEGDLYVEHIQYLAYFKAGEIGPGRFLKVAGAVFPAFRKRFIHRKHIGGFQNHWDRPKPVSKAFCATLRNLLSSMSRRI